MRTGVRLLIVLLIMGGALAGLVVVGGLLVWLGFGQPLPMLLVVILGRGLCLYAHLRYRQARQDELLQVLATAVEADLPLAPAVRSYLRDRPHQGEGGWDILLLFLCPPGY